MIKVLIDTDIILDVALGREEFVQNSSEILNYAESGRIRAFIAWHSISNFYYITHNGSANRTNVQFLKDLLRFVEVAPTTTEDVLYAFELNFSNFEDALQVAAAKACNSKYLITRNVKHYKNSPIPAVTPQSFLEI